jgi:hypothetical protein
VRSKILCLVLALFMPGFLASWAATRVSASCSLADVTAAVSSAAEGDTVTIPAGSATWTGSLTVTKGITIQGQGGAVTVLTASGNIALFVLSPGSDKSMRITGIGFVGGYGTVHLSGAMDGSYVWDKFRIDHCSFASTSTAIWAAGWLEGLIDHNSFLNVNRGILVYGDDDYAWNRPIAAGTSHALFIEDNAFTITNAGGAGLNECVYHQDGARTVIRHNTFDASAYTIDNAYIFDSHGNFQYWINNPQKDQRGQPIIEIYNNTFLANRIAFFIPLRGGSVLVHDNTFTVTGASAATVVGMTDEESWQTTLFSPLRTAWPAQDQVSNMFIWNNTLKGNIALVADIHPEDAPFFQQDRDYFLHAPQSSGGYEYFTGSRAGGSTAAPTASDTGSMAFSSSGANAYYPYTPYTYPHPLQGAATAPGIPTGLRIQ